MNDKLTCWRSFTFCPWKLVCSLLSLDLFLTQYFDYNIMDYINYIIKYVYCIVINLSENIHIYE